MKINGMVNLYGGGKLTSFYFLICLSFYFSLFSQFFLFILSLFSYFSDSYFYFLHFFDFISFSFFKMKPNENNFSWPRTDLHMRSSTKLNDTKYVFFIFILFFFLLCHKKGHETSITFHQETWHQACVVFMLSAHKSATAKTCFLHYYISVKTLQTLLQVLLHWNVST